MNALQIDNDREYIQWWIEDAEWWDYDDQWLREHSPGYVEVSVDEILVCTE